MSRLEQRVRDSKTPRGRRIMGLVAEGFTDVQIAEKLGVKVGTVTAYVNGGLHAVGCTNRTQYAILHHTGRPALSIQDAEGDSLLSDEQLLEIARFHADRMNEAIERLHDKGRLMQIKVEEFNKRNTISKVPKLRVLGYKPI